MKRALPLSLTLLSVALAGPARATAGRGFQNDIIYGVMVDRFSNGNRANDVPLWAFPSDSAYDTANRYWLRKTYQDPAVPSPGGVDIQKYWGGDLRGLISKLGYLQDLGVTVLMVSPIFENVNGYNYRLGGSAYHGYWTKDFKRLEEHFVDPPLAGDEKILRELVEKSHALGMKVVLDIPLNHTSPAPIGTTLRDPYNFLEMGALYDDGHLVARPCAPTAVKSCGETYSNSGWFHSPPIWVQWDRAETLWRGNINGNLADLDQHQPMVKEYLIGALRKWMSYGVDGFRLDAAKNMYPDFLQDVERELQALRPDVLLIGEYFDGGLYDDALRPSKNASVRWLDSFSRITMFDFSFAKATREFFRGNASGLGTSRALQVILDEKDRSNFFGDRAIDLVNFVNNHDEPRMLSLPGSSFPRFEAALELLLLSHGVPSLMYGDEIGLAIPSDHPEHWKNQSRENAEWSRLFMDWSVAERTPPHPTRALVKRLIALRKQNDYLRDGPTHFLKASNLWNLFQGNSYVAVLREDPAANATRKLLFVYSRAPRATLEFAVPFADGDYADPVHGKTWPVRGGQLRLANVAADERIVLQVK
jgi:glycosidase